MGGPEKWQKRGRAKRVLSRFCRLVTMSRDYFRIAPLSLKYFREIFFEFRLIYSQSISDRFSAHVRPVVHIIFSYALQIRVQYI